jgi:hypothetical protein
VNARQTRINTLLGGLLIITLMVFVLGLFSTAAALLEGHWTRAFGSLGVTVLLGLLAGILRLWMRATAIALRQIALQTDDGQLSLGDVLAQAHQSVELEKRGGLESWLETLSPKKRRKLLTAKLEEQALAEAALRIATAIGMASYIARRATRQGLLPMISEALREQHANPLWAHAFEFDELTEFLLKDDPHDEEALAEQLRHFLADTKAEHLVSVLAATLPEDLLAGSIVAYAEPEQLVALLERININ